MQSGDGQATYCLAPDELFDNDPGEDVLHEVLAQGFLPCGGQGRVGPWCATCQWSSAIDYPIRERPHRRRLCRTESRAGWRDVPDDPPADQLRLESAERVRQHARFRRLRQHQ